MICHSCNKEFENWDELTHHIIEEISKKGYTAKIHKKSAKFAHSYKQRSLLRTQTEYKNNGDDPDKPHTEYGDENREKMRVRLSGENHTVDCICPKCKKHHKTQLPVEYLESPLIWKSDNQPVKICLNCNGRI